MRLWLNWPPWKEPPEEAMRRELRSNLDRMQAAEKRIAANGTLDRIDQGIKEATAEARAALQSRPDAKAG